MIWCLGVKVCGGIFDFDKKKIRLKEIEIEFEDPSIWVDQIKAKDLNHERKSLEKVVSNLSSIEIDLDNIQELIELASSENDDVVMGEIALDLEQIEEKISKISLLISPS